MRREYKLARNATFRQSGAVRREILQIPEDGDPTVVLVVTGDDAIDVVAGLTRAYQDGREDRAASTGICADCGRVNVEVTVTFDRHDPVSIIRALQDAADPDALLTAARGIVLAAEGSA